MVLIRTNPPADSAALRQALYGGLVFRMPPTPTSRWLVAETLAALQEELHDCGPVRPAQFRMTNDEFFPRMGRLRKRFYLGSRFHQAVRDLLAECGFNPERTAFDPIRLRVVAHRGFEEPSAAPVYYAHRDTWYANPQAQLTWWIPLHDLTETETFVFYPDWFRRAVPNNSEVFDYDEWTRHGWDLKVGWQDPQAGSRHIYPTVQADVQAGETVSFRCQAGEVLLFAGAHFHQTVKNVSGQTRFSLDFRTVDLDDHAQGQGAPNVDNRSRGADSLLRDYVQPADRAAATWLSR